jgi:hypothetical protein
MTANSFKERYRNHKKSFTNATYMNETELSKYIWKLKQNGRPFTLTWSILRHAAPYSSGGKQCSLCTQEKLQSVTKQFGQNSKRAYICNIIDPPHPPFNVACGNTCAKCSLPATQHCLGRGREG